MTDPANTPDHRPPETRTSDPELDSRAPGRREDAADFAARVDDFYAAHPTPPRPAPTTRSTPRRWPMSDRVHEQFDRDDVADPNDPIGLPSLDDFELRREFGRLITPARTEGGPATPSSYRQYDDVNPVCGCHMRSRCASCASCTSCDSCYCGEDY